MDDGKAEKVFTYLSILLLLFIVFTVVVIIKLYK